MNDITHKFLWAGDKFMPEMHLRDPIVGTYSACGPFTKYRQRIQKFIETSNTDYIYKNELDKTSFQHDMTYGDFKDLKRRTQSDKVLKDKQFKVAANTRYNGYKRGLASLVYKFFDKKSKGGSILNEQLANELHKPIIKKFKKRKVNSSYKDNIWGVDLADMQLISKTNKGIKYLLCLIDLFSKYGVSIVNTFPNILDNSVELHSKRKPNKIWVDQGIEFYNNVFKK